MFNIPPLAKISPAKCFIFNDSQKLVPPKNSGLAYQSQKLFPQKLILQKLIPQKLIPQKLIPQKLIPTG